METILEFLKSNLAKRFYWQTFAGFLGLMIVFLGSIDWIWAPIIISIISGATKEINNKYGGITD
jgi:hypothetical protein